MSARSKTGSWNRAGDTCNIAADMVRLYVGGDFECIREIINMGAIVEGNIRFFVGYSGWEKGQLRKELDNFEWAVGQSIVADVLNLRENDAWRKAVKDMGARYKVWLNVPLDAQLN